MKICAIIAEFNIFHNGHEYLLKQVRLKGYSHIVVIMSGNFVQRGEAAIISKQARAKIALKSGVDLVVELPTVKSILTAEKYAFSAIKLIEHLGCVDAIAFGSESGDFEKLRMINKAMQNSKFGEILRENLKKGVSFPVARSHAIASILKDPESERTMKAPNDILAIEYLKALNSLNLNISPLVIKRFEDSKVYLSASSIRKLILKNDKSYKSYIPKFSNIFVEDEIENYKAPVDFFSSNRAIVSKLRGLSLEELSALPDISEGIENRIYKAIKNSCTASEIIFNIKTKRYSLSRIKRIILCAFLGIKSTDSEKTFEYIKLLGIGKKGLEILNKMKVSANLPVVSRYTDTFKLKKSAKEFFDSESLYTDLYNSLTPNIFPCGLEKQFKLIKDDDIEL